MHVVICFMSFRTESFSQICCDGVMICWSVVHYHVKRNHHGHFCQGSAIRTHQHIHHASHLIQTTANISVFDWRQSCSETCCTIFKLSASSPEQLQPFQTAGGSFLKRDRDLQNSLNLALQLTYFRWEIQLPKFLCRRLITPKEYIMMCFSGKVRLIMYPLVRVDIQTIFS